MPRLNDYENLNNFVSQMRSGDKDAIIQGLLCDGVLLRINAIIGAALNKCLDPAITKQIIKLSTDKSDIFGNFRVSDFANAALSILGVRDYTGNREETNQLIASGMKF